MSDHMFYAKELRMATLVCLQICLFSDSVPRYCHFSGDLVKV